MLKTELDILDLTTPVGVLRLAADEQAIRSIKWTRTARCGRTRNSVLCEAAKQIREYFWGRRFVFELPVKPEGTEFQMLVWRFCGRIPFGSTQTYGKLAQKVGRPGAARAVGTAMAANPLPLIIPCHRVVGTAGLGGYSGAGGLTTKRFLLQFETKRKLRWQ